MISHDEKTLYLKLASQSGLDIAKHFRCAYSGDRDPINHDGVFYDPRDWESYGYASCVEFWTDPENGNLMVSCGVIHKDDDMSGAFACSGIDQDSDDARNIHCQIDCCRSYSGIEPDDYQITRRYNLDNWAEWRIWRSVAHLLRQLGE